MAKRKAPAPPSPAIAAQTNGRATKAEAAKVARNARQPDLLDLLTKKPKATRTRTRKEMPGLKG
jgi:hypothetical protein